MLAALLPLVPLLVQVVPQIASWIGGDDAEDVARQVTGVVAAVAGGTDEAAVAAALADPAQRAALVERLARIAAEREAARDAAMLARMQAALADTAHARDTTVRLVHAGSALQWGAPVVSLVVLLLFAFVVVMEQFGWSSLGDGTKRLLETAMTLVLGYWVGSSAGSWNKDLRQAQAQPAGGESPRSLFGGR